MRAEIQKLPDIRCAWCGRKHGEGHVLIFSFKCRKCGRINVLRASRPGSAPQDCPSEPVHDNQ